METDIDVDQFLTTIYRYIQLGVHIKAYYSKQYGKFHREVDEVVEFYVDENNKPISHILYQKTFGQKPVQNMPSKNLLEYLENQNINIDNLLTNKDSMVNLDSELEKMETPSTSEEKVTIVTPSNTNEQLVTPSIIPVMPEVNQNVQSITPINNSQQVVQNSNTVSPVTGQNIPFPSEVL